MQSEEHIEDHPWNYYGSSQSRILLVGTFPPTCNNWSFDFFYPNRRNLMWKVLATIANKNLKFDSGNEAVAERKQILNDLAITITDMGKSIIRLHQNSSDENLKIVTYMDIIDILKNRSNIRKIIFTSSSGKVSAMKWFQNYIQSQGIKFTFPKGKLPIRATIQLLSRSIELVVLYTTSPRATNRISFENLVNLYKSEILLSKIKMRTTK